MQNFAEWTKWVIVVTIFSNVHDEICFISFLRKSSFNYSRSYLEGDKIEVLQIILEKIQNNSLPITKFNVKNKPQTLSLWLERSLWGGLARASWIRIWIFKSLFKRCRISVHIGIATWFLYAFNLQFIRTIFLSTKTPVCFLLVALWWYQETLSCIAAFLFVIFDSTVYHLHSYIYVVQCNAIRRNVAEGSQLDPGATRSPLTKKFLTGRLTVWVCVLLLTSRQAEQQQ